MVNVNKKGNDNQKQQWKMDEKTRNTQRKQASNSEQ